MTMRLRLALAALLALGAPAGAESTFPPGPGSSSVAGTTVCGSLTAANMNTTADQAITITPPSPNYVVQSVRFWSPSTSMTTAQGGVYTGTAKSGVAVVSASQSYSGLTTASPNTTGNYLAATAATVALNVTTMYLSLTIAQSPSGTANVTINCFPLQ